MQWFVVAMICFLPLHIIAVMLDEWATRPPLPLGDGPDYEAIGFCLSRGEGWSYAYSDQEWRSAYEQATRDESTLSYAIQLARRGPTTPDTNRPPLLPLCIATIYQFLPRGPIAFAAVRIWLACCLSIGCAMSVAWGVWLADSNEVSRRPMFRNAIAVCVILWVFSERNLRNYAIDFLTEPMALAVTQIFLVVAWVGVRKGTWRWAIATGGLFAGMYFCRALFILWIPLLAVWLWILCRIESADPAAVLETRSTRGKPLPWTAICLLSFGVISSGWWIRNCFVLGDFQPLGTKGPTTLIGGYCDDSIRESGEWVSAPEKELRAELEAAVDWQQVTSMELLSLEKEIGLKAKEQVTHWIKSNLRSLPSLFVQRIVNEWNPYHGKALVLKLLAVVGVLWLAVYHRIALLWLLGPLAFNTLVAMATYSAGGRFLVPTYGCLYILAAFGMAAILTRLLGSLAIKDFLDRVDRSGASRASDGRG